jgi:hypothetical protein
MIHGRTLRAAVTLVTGLGTALALSALGTGPAGASTHPATTARAPAASTHPATTAHAPAAGTRIVPVSTPRLSGLMGKSSHKLRLSLAKGNAYHLKLPKGIHPLAETPGFEMINDDSGLCLNANTSGPSAGQNGDKVQQWGCYSSANEEWYGVQVTGNWWWLVSAQYPDMCLNVNSSGGLGNGSAVQLWNCYETYNEYWYNVGGWYTDCMDFGGWWSIAADYGNYTLDADANEMRQGGKVQIWTYYGSSDEFWATW